MSARRVAVVTGTRAEYGLLRPVIRACEAREDLDVHVIATGAHLLPTAATVEEVERECGRTVRVEMQRPGEGGRPDDARALGRGIESMSRVFEELRPGIVLVLGDRIEAFAGACAASVGGILCAHVHGGDRAEGVADESMRHAMTKLAHLHLAATETSAERIVRMGEPDRRVRVVGSPAIDGLDGIAPVDSEGIGRITVGALDGLDAVFLMHPLGRAEEAEYRDASAALDALGGMRALCLSPNSDAGREGIVRAIGEACAREAGFVRADHLERREFLGALKHLARSGGVIVGNSSCALIECAAIGLGAVDVGDRQGGRERAGNVVEPESAESSSIRGAIERARELSGSGFAHPYGPGDAGARIAEALVSVDTSDPWWLRKRNVY